jgi:hypothetical protein
MVRPWLACWWVLAACGAPSQVSGDAAGSDDADSGDAGSGDAGSDAAGEDAIDAAMGVLSPDPTDPVSLPCTGTLGFPGVPTVLPEPSRALSFLVADANADGIPDILHSDLERIGISLGVGNGTFGATTIYTAPQNTLAFRVAELTGDGKPDLVFANQQTIQIAPNNGAGSFGSPQSYAATIPSIQIEVLDVNGDGRKDLIGLDQNGNVAVLLATATAFAAAQTYTAGAQYTHVMALADVTGDGRPDLVATNNVGTVSVLANAGNGTFPTRVTYPTPPGPWGLVLADMNEDGRLDVVVGALSVVGNDAKPVLGVLLNQGSSGFGAPTSYPFGDAGFQPREVAAGDVNGDGHMDITGAYTLDSNTRILLGTGSGALGTQLELATGELSLGVGFSDLDRNGRTDLIVLQQSVTPYLNNGTPAPFEVRARHQLPGVTFMRGARTVDLDDDGRLDLVGLGDDGPTTSIAMARLGTGGGAFAAATGYPVTHIPGRTILADLNNDGRRDLVTANHGVDALLVPGDGTLVAMGPIPLSPPAVSVRAGDVNNDGFRDLLLTVTDTSSNPSSSLLYLRGLGNGGFAPSTSLWNTQYIYGAALIDVDGDAKLDIVVDDYNNGYRRSVLGGLGNGTFAAPIVTSLSQHGYDLHVRDVNADGKPDLVGATPSPGVGEIAVMLGTGTTTIAAPLVVPAHFQSDLAFADFNGDGHLDLVTGSRSEVGVLLGRGDGSFSAPAYYDAGVAVFTISTGDVDGDGRVDIIVDNDTDQVSVLRGRCL